MRNSAYISLMVAFNYLKLTHRVTLLGKAKVDGQSKLYCLIHNIEMLAQHGNAA